MNFEELKELQAKKPVPRWQNRDGRVITSKDRPGPDYLPLFSKSAKQREACQMMIDHKHSLLVGGARSTKTAIAVRQVIARAMRKPSRHLITRSCFNHAKQSIWYDTFPKVFKGFWPYARYQENKSDWFITVPCIGGGESQIWLGGTDSKERTEKILGNEYSTILANEVSQIDYETITMLRTRLAEDSGLGLKFLYDLNPVGKKHWTYQEFIKKINPEDGSPSILDTSHLFMNPIDNPYLPPEVLLDYLALPKRKRDRFLYGLYLEDIEGALWTDLMISQARGMDYGDLKKVVVAVDPAVTHREDSDETGIVICGLDEFDKGVVLDDWSLKASTGTWAQRVINAYHTFEANEIVVEVNQGGDLVRDVLKNIDQSIKVVDVRASKGKFARAEPVSELYELGKVAHAKEMSELEAQLTEYVPKDSKKSPDRLDALVWGITSLMVKQSTQINIGSV